MEQTIEAGRKTFVEVGLALAEIRDSKLFRSDFDTFEAYCQSKWKMGRRYANLLIESSAVVKSLPMGTIVPTEGQARALSKVEPAKRVEVLTKAAESGPVTAKKIHEAAAVVIPKNKTAPANRSGLVFQVVVNCCDRFAVCSGD